MSKIIKLEGTEVYIGMDDQKIVKSTDQRRELS